MRALSEVLKKVKIVKSVPTGKKRNPDWEDAVEFGAYVNINPKMVMVLFKKYGKEAVLSLRGWLKDVPNARSFYSLAIYKLKKDQLEKTKLTSS